MERWFLRETSYVTLLSSTLLSHTSSTHLLRLPPMPKTLDPRPCGPLWELIPRRGPEAAMLRQETLLWLMECCGDKTGIPLLAPRLVSLVDWSFMWCGGEMTDLSDPALPSALLRLSQCEPMPHEAVAPHELLPAAVAVVGLQTGVGLHVLREVMLHLELLGADGAVEGPQV